MKKAIIYFEEKEVERVNFEKMYNTEELSFFVGNDEVAFFPKGYAFVIIENDVFSVTVNSNDIVSVQKNNRGTIENVK